MSQCSLKLLKDDLKLLFFISAVVLTSVEQSLKSLEFELQAKKEKNAGCWGKVSNYLAYIYGVCEVYLSGGIIATDR